MPIIAKALVVKSELPAESVRERTGPIHKSPVAAD